MIHKVDKKQAELEKIKISEEKKKILRQRALLLKREPEKEEEVGSVLNGIEFLLGEERYFVDSNFVVEVAHLKELTPLPGTPPYILGIFNIHGKILAVISLKKLLNLPENAITNHNRIIFIEYNGIELGILADEIMGTKTIRTNNFQLNVPGISEKQEGFLTGITKEGLILLNIEKLITDSRITINQKI